jgi:UDP-3-O-[3-hydroxymyristoyl] N-acetylglucosamine deacetylase
MERSRHVQYQSTLRDLIAFEGVGLHTGTPARVTVRPDRPGSGLHFRLEDGTAFPAHGRYVLDTSRATVLGIGERRVSTVEHLLSALVGMNVDNARIEVEGDEIPVCDGSALVFAEAIAAVGLRMQGEARRRFAVTAPAIYRDGDKSVVVAPAAHLRVTVAVDYAPPVGAQFLDLEITPETYLTEIAPARTFGFKHEIESLIRRGLALGGTLDNAVVYGPDGPLNALRFPNEAVRHKALDLIGDLALLGAVPQFQAFAVKSGHKLHATAVQDLAREHGAAVVAAAAAAP